MPDGHRTAEGWLGHSYPRAHSIIDTLPGDIPRLTEDGASPLQRGQGMGGDPPSGDKNSLRSSTDGAEGQEIKYRILQDRETNGRPVQTAGPRDYAVGVQMTRK